ncbi:MAG: hypothetical protein MI808_03530 [Pseudomonadales bacterium]|nr:hypothetical protein [Pseudomonadales bacterium]
MRFIFILSSLIALGLNSAVATPVLYFNGSFSFDSSTDSLQVTATVDNAINVSQPVSNNSTFTFTTQLLGVQGNGPLVESNFGSQQNGNDFSIIDGTNTLLDGTINSLLMSGFQGSNFGALTGDLDASGGSLLNDFLLDTSLFALQLNLTSPFSLTMFDGDFSGLLDGSLTGVPASISEPAPISILMMGLCALIYIRRKQK